MGGVRGKRRAMDFPQFVGGKKLICECIVWQLWCCFLVGLVCCFICCVAFFIRIYVCDGVAGIRVSRVCVYGFSTKGNKLQLSLLIRPYFLHVLKRSWEQLLVDTRSSFSFICLRPLSPRAFSAFGLWYNLFTVVNCHVPLLMSFV